MAMFRMNSFLMVGAFFLFSCSNTNSNKKPENRDIHPLDKMVQNLENKEAEFFSDQPISDDFHVLSEAAGTEETGAYPQVSSMNPKECHKLYYNEIPDDSVNLGAFIVRKDALLSDFLSCAALSADGFLISKKAKSVFDIYNLGEHKYYPATIVDNGDTINYYWLHLKTDQSNHIDYQNSMFYIERGMVNGDKQSVRINSLNEYLKMREELLEEWEKNDGRIPFVKAKKLILTESFDQALDIFGFAKMNNEIYISNRLKEAILENNLTGVAIKETRKIHLFNKESNPE